jgi:flagellar operon protein
MRVHDLQIQSKIYPLDSRKLHEAKPGKSADGKDEVGGGQQSFSDILQKTLEAGGLKFSGHAIKRLEERELSLSSAELQRLNNGVDQLDRKGSQKSVILLDQTAYIVNVPGRLVVTAIDQASSTENVFTNIDSVAIV